MNSPMNKPTVQGKSTENNTNREQPQHTIKPAGIALGVGVGLALYTATGSIGVAIGVGIALAAAVSLNAKDDEKADTQTDRTAIGNTI